MAQQIQARNGGRSGWVGYLWAIAATAVCTGIGFLMVSRFDPVNIAMIYLLAVVVIALRFSRGAAIFMSVLSVAAFDFLFVAPHGTLSVHDAQYLLTFAIMLTVALIISHLTENVRRQAEQGARLVIDAETQRVRSALLASISHDLRTPLAVMTGASSSLAEIGDNLPPDERQAMARSIFNQCRELSERVAKVLQMTRLEQGAFELQRDWASLSEIAAGAVRLLRDAFARHGLTVDVAEDLPLVRVDAALVEQALVNLLENAVTHTPPGTRVRLHARREPGRLLVSVEDDGGGLEGSRLEAVFAKFEHAGSGGKGGMGLGLSICRAIVSLHGGEVWAERLPAGTAVRFTLPVDEQAPLSPPEPAVT